MTHDPRTTRMTQDHAWHPANRPLKEHRIKRHQIAALLLAKQLLGGDDDLIRRLMWVADGVRSIRPLSQPGYQSVMFGLSVVGVLPFVVIEAGNP